MFFTVGICFILLSVMMLWMIIGSVGNVIIKGLLIVSCCVFSMSLFYTMETLKGWPTATELPNKFEVFGIRVNEPVKLSSYKGEIFIWVKNINENKAGFLSLYKPKPDDNRLYTLPYSLELHKKALKIQKMLRKGQRVMGTNGKGKGRGRGRGKGRNGNRGNSTEQGPKAKFRFYRLPKINLPEKKE